MIAVLGSGRLGQKVTRVVYINIISIEVAAENSFVCFNIPLIGVRLAKTSIATLDSHIIFEQERGVPLTTAIWMGQIPIRLINTLGHSNLGATWGSIESILQEIISIFP